MTLRIGIVGAGIGGLAAAALLARRGHAVTIAARFAVPRPLGSARALRRAVWRQGSAGCGAMPGAARF